MSSTAERPTTQDHEAEETFDVAIVAMAGRFPGACDVDALWSMLAEGRHAFREIDEETYLAAGGDPGALTDDRLIRTEATIDGVDAFDAGFFGYAPREAARLDPQQRLFLQACHHAFEQAGHDPARFDGPVGVYAGASEGGYYVHNVLPEVDDAPDSMGAYAAVFSNLASSLPTRVSYHFDLHGPSMAVQTGCSASLVAVHQACQDLIAGQCDLALAGGASVNPVPGRGYRHEPDGVLAPDGRCRAFSDDAAGMVNGDGVAVVALRRLDDALRDGDPIRAVIRGSAVNNDGGRKVGFTAPSRDGQRDVLLSAHALAGVDPSTIGLVEAHGTGTAVGDPIEVAALTAAFAAGHDRPEGDRCALGSIKTNIGHTDSAAGVSGLIKAVLALEHRQIPASLGFRAPNPELDLDRTPFRIPTALEPWPARGDAPRRAAVSAFGIGGTNAHVVLEEAPDGASTTVDAPDRPTIVALSAHRPDVLDDLTTALADALEAPGAPALRDVAHTLRAGRTVLPHRRTVVARGPAEAARALRTTVGTAAPAAPEHGRPLAFVMPGYGPQHDLMGAGLDADPVFRATVDEAHEATAALLPGVDLRAVLRTPGGISQRADDAPPVALSALVATGVGLARALVARGVRPDALAGHSLGESIAAVVAGVMRLEDAIALAVARERLVIRAGGAMVAVLLGEDDLRPHLGDCALAAVNGPAHCTVSGTHDQIDALVARLISADVQHQRLTAPFAAHSHVLDPILDEYGAVVRTVPLRAPQVPLISNVTGTWLTDDQARDPAYWTGHLRATVRFADGLATLHGEGAPVLLECGPGRSMTRFAAGIPGALALPAMRHPDADTDDVTHLEAALGRAWELGVDLGPEALGARGDVPARRVALPAYPFRAERHWITPPPAGADAAPGTGRTARPSDAAAGSASTDPRTLVAGWRTHVPAAPTPGPHRWILLAGDRPVAAALADRLEERGDTVTVTALPAGADPTGTPDLRERLAAAVADGGPAPRIVDLRPLDDEEADRPGELFALARDAASAAGDAGPLDVWTCARGLHLVVGTEAVDPDRRALSGLAAALDGGGVRLHVLDLDPAVDPDDAWLATALAGPPVPLLARRGPGTWAPDLRPVDPPAGAPAMPPLQDLRPGLVARERALRDVHPVGGPPPAVTDGLDRLTALHLLDWLDGRGVLGSAGTSTTVGELHAALGVTPGLRRWLVAVLVALAEDGLVALSDTAAPGDPTVVRFADGDPLARPGADRGPEIERLGAEIAALAPDHRIDVDVLAHCAAGLDPVVRGTTDPAELLFPDGVSAIYRPIEDRRFAVSDANVYRALIAETLAELATEAGRPLRILEVGAGRGLLSFTVAEALQGHDVEYHYTDLGRSLVLLGQRTAAERGLDHLMRFGVLDVGRDPVAQGYPEEAFDVVLAYNVLHATPDIPGAVRNATAQLRPGGLLVVLDLATLPRDALLTAGLMDELWAYDDVRTVSPVADTADWRGLLADQGLGDAIELARAPESRDSADQHALYVARRPGATGIPEPTVTVLRGTAVAPPTDVAGELVRVLPDPQAGPGDVAAWADVAAAATPLLRELDLLEHAQSTGALPGPVTIVAPSASRPEGAPAAELAAERAAAIAERRARTGGPAWRVVRWRGPRRRLDGPDRSDGVPAADDPLTAVLRATRTIGTGVLRVTDREPAEDALAAEIPVTPADAFNRRPTLPVEFVAPRDERERTVAEVWEEVLGVRPVGVEDSFFDLGGESLLALQVVGRLRERLDGPVALRDVLLGRTVAGLVAALDAPGDDADGGAGAPPADGTSAPDPAVPGPAALAPRRRGRTMRRAADGSLLRADAGTDTEQDR